MAVAPIKPKLRGVSHQVAAFAFAIAGVWLLTQTKGRMWWGCLIYVIALCGQLSVSALYHRPTWGPQARQWWRRLDHAFIMILIAGTGTPLALALPDDSSRSLLLIFWGGAALGVLRALVWITAPKVLATGLALGLAWLAAPFLSTLYQTLGLTTTLWLVAGGVLYSLGAVAYAAKRPNPWPEFFGYHEVFHAFVILAAAAHFVAITRFAT